MHGEGSKAALKDILAKCINKAFNENKFPDTLKLSDLVSVFKDLDPNDKTNFSWSFTFIV